MIVKSYEIKKINIDEKKFVLFYGKNEGLKLQRTYDKKRVLSYIFENDSLGKRISTTLRGSKDSIYYYGL